MKYFIYCRKSSDREDKQVLGTQSQKRILTEYAKKNGLKITDTYIEKKSAYKKGRPLFNEMMERMQQGEAVGILTYHLTRLARNSYDGGNIIYMMDEKIIQEIRTPESKYIGTSDDKFLMQIHFAMAKKSSDDTSNFVQRDIEGKLLNGEYPGRVPMGYVNINKDGGITKERNTPEKYQLLTSRKEKLQREEIDPIDGELVVMLFEEASRGMKSIPELCEYSFSIGLRSYATGKQLTKNALMNLLTNHYVYGVIEYRGTVYFDERYDESDFELPTVKVEKIKHDALISKELFDRVQFALTQRKRKSYKKHLHAFGNMLIRCGECGCAITAEKQKGIQYYHCTGNSKTVVCTQKTWIREKKLQAELTKSVVEALSVPQQFLDIAFKKVRKLYKKEAKQFDAMRQKLQKQYDSCKRRLDKLLMMKCDELIDDDEYQEQRKRFKLEMNDINAQLQNQHGDNQQWIDDCETFIDFTQRIARQFVEASPEDKQALMRLLASNLVLKDGKVACEYHEPFASLSKFTFAGEVGKEKFEQLKSADKAKILDGAPNCNPILTDWLGRRDSNPRVTGPEPVALPLGYAPLNSIIVLPRETHHSCPFEALAKEGGYAPLMSIRVAKREIDVALLLREKLSTKFDQLIKDDMQSAFRAATNGCKNGILLLRITEDACCYDMSAAIQTK